MKLCVGAGSRRVVEEAAKLQVPQIVASRSQVDIGGGYIGLDQYQLVELVKELSNERTDVVRDHGGPHQRSVPLGEDDDHVASFECDVEAGFDGLHIDVCKIDTEKQTEVLGELLEEFGHLPGCYVEVGGERDPQAHLDALVNFTLRQNVVPKYAVIDLGGHIFADRQQGTPKPVTWVRDSTARLHLQDISSKAHNMDWLGRRQRYDGVLDAFNVAPEYSAIEVEAWLMVMDGNDAVELLEYAYESQRWQRWFGFEDGTLLEKAKCALRYVLDDGVVASYLAPYLEDHEDWVRGRIRDALRSG